VQARTSGARDFNWRDRSPHLAILWRRKWLIGLVALGSALCALVFTLAQRPNYTATAMVHVATRSSIANDQVRPDDLTYVDRLENTYADLATSRGLVDELVKDLGLSDRPGVQVRAVPNTELMDIDVTTHDRDTAAMAANRLAALLIARVRALNLANRGAEADLASRIEQIRSDLTAMRNRYGTLAARGPRSPQQSARLLEVRQEISSSQSRLSTLQDSLDTIRFAREERANSLSVVEPAIPPSTPSNRQLFRNLALALLVGIVGGTGLAYLAERVRPRVHGDLDLEEAAGAPILVSVPSVHTEDGGSAFNGGSSAEEAFRRLRLVISPLKQRHALVITSPGRGDGKTTVAVNLARAVAQAGQRVVLIDADLRRPALHTRLAQPGEPGFRDVLEGSRTDVIQRTDVPNLFLIPAGAASDSAGQLLEAADWAGTLRKLRAEFDVVLIDAPPVLDVSDSLLLAAPSDGVLLVLRSSSVPRDVLRRTQEELEGAGGRIVGLVVNRTERQRQYSPSWPSLHKFSPSWPNR
jgi:succinoglycan biosynthesis transport protein ExoP